MPQYAHAQFTQSKGDKQCASIPLYEPSSFSATDKRTAVLKPFYPWTMQVRATAHDLAREEGVALLVERHLLHVHLHLVGQVGLARADGHRPAQGQVVVEPCMAASAPHGPAPPFGTSLLFGTVWIGCRLLAACCSANIHHPHTRACLQVGDAMCSPWPKVPQVSKRPSRHLQAVQFVSK